ncbi:MAG: pseudaminic acid cytidylyltransferase [Aquabacterium sp.]|nr:pseudaminic acid cytidylyltransferase [Aquabacterium sp.]
MNTQRLAVIPARGGSKRIPRKNARAFAGRPMVTYAISAAQDSGVFTRIVVSTDDDEIADIARHAGADVPFMRPANLADDHAGTVPVIAHAIDALAWPDGQAVCCIYPGVPLLAPADIVQALALLESSGCSHVFPVLAFESPVQRALLRDANGIVKPMYPEFTLTRTQDLAPAFHDAGQFYWGWPSAWRSGISPFAQGRSIIVPATRAVDIDTHEDWLRAEMLYNAAKAV